MLRKGVQSFLTPKANLPFISKFFSSKIDPEKIPEEPQDLKNSTKYYEHTTNYNLEEHPGYSQRVQKAKDQRAWIEQLKKEPIIPKKKRYYTIVQSTIWTSLSTPLTENLVIID